MRYIGIDPGVTGAVALIDTAFDLDVELYDAPVVEGTGKRKEVSEQAAAALLRSLCRDGPGINLTNVFAVLEKVGPMPSMPGPDGKRRGMGATSAFSFGAGWGVWKGVLAGIGIPFELVTPQRWKKAMLEGMPKAAARQVATRLYPQIADKLARKKDLGRAEALLMAEYARRLR